MIGGRRARSSRGSRASGASVALIGGDGSGKTTLADAIANGIDRPVKRIYMGSNLESSTHLLPWSKIALAVRLRLLRRKFGEQAERDPLAITTHHMRYRVRSGGAVRAALRYTNRLTEMTYRSMLVERWKRQGFLVVQDRHFLFDVYVVDGPIRELDAVDRVTRIYDWTIRRLPLPDLVLFLHADPEVMISRKPEASAEYLRGRNEYWKKRSRLVPCVAILDANRTADEVLRSAMRSIHGLVGDERGAGEPR